ncbi:GAF domain-containing protein [Nocardia amikacinitolerans]|uniref:GAF domain-containing protein n=1 Tax=Nocardia amikacinitolerans TaxID=756689 RepID=UPI0020A2B260|nr:GAF domain-containing protein [Nocardia amikacinitolerans]MCP2297627.1 GAF domain-containing protein [Nocardia amikacinitolerans]
MLDTRPITTNFPGSVTLFPNKSSAIPAQAAANIARLLPNHPLVGITAWGLDGLEVVGCSDQQAATAEQALLEFPDSPGMDVIRRRSRILIPDLAATSRWRDYCAHLRELGIRSLYCHPLVSDGQVLGLLSMYSHRTNAFRAKE